MRLYDLEVEVKSWRRRKALFLRPGESGTGGENREEDLEDDDDDDDDQDQDEEGEDELGVLAGDLGSDGMGERKGRGKKRRLTGSSNKDRPGLLRNTSGRENNNDTTGINQETKIAQSRLVGSIWEPKDDLPELIKVIARCINRLTIGGLGVEKKDPGWSVNTVEGLWNRRVNDMFLPPWSESSNVELIPYRSDGIASSRISCPTREQDFNVSILLT